MSKTKPPNIRKLVLVHATSEGVVYRDWLYEERGSVLFATEENDKPSAPYGLRRVRTSALPKMGGLLGTVVLAADKASGRERLRRYYVDEVQRFARDLATASKLLAAVEKNP